MIPAFHRKHDEHHGEHHEAERDVDAYSQSIHFEIRKSNILLDRKNCGWFILS